MARENVVPFPVPPVVDDDDDDEGCPNCPPVGAPAWLATFADIATNLMAFFVLILGFAQFDEPSFKKFAGAMRDQFGVRVIEGNGLGSSVIELETPKNPDDSPENKSAPGDGETGDGGAQDDGANAAPAADPLAQQIASALSRAMAQGEIVLDTPEGGPVTIALDNANDKDAALALAQAIASVAGGKVVPDQQAGQETGAPLAGDDPEVLVSGAEAPDATGQDAPAEGTLDQGSKTGVPDAGMNGESHVVTVQTEGEATSPALPGETVASSVRSELTARGLARIFEQQIGDGALSVEQRDGKVYVTLGAGGSFASGSADMTEEARAIMAQIATVGDRPDRRIVVTGHTDDVPVSGGQFRDNIDLAAARAASVMRALAESGVDPASITAESKGEFEPIADNATEEGRAKNRRIEIEITYGP